MATVKVYAERETECQFCGDVIPYGSGFEDFFSPVECGHACCLECQVQHHDGYDLCPSCAVQVVRDGEPLEITATQAANMAKFLANDAIEGGPDGDSIPLHAALRDIADILGRIRK